MELSSRARTGYVLLLLAASAMTAIIGALLFTEQGLPQRTSLSLAAMTLIGLGWIAFAAWVLSRKRILLGKPAVVAGRMAVAFTAVFTVGAIAIGYATQQPAAKGAGALGLVMLGVAVLMWVRAKRHFTALSNRRHTLERELEQLSNR
jgi:hypothetical protein